MLYSCFPQCSGSVTFDTDLDPYHWFTDSDPALFFRSLEDATKITFFLSFIAYYLVLVHLHQSSKKTGFRKKYRSRFLSIFLLVGVRIRTNNNDESGWPKGFGSGSWRHQKYLDPEQWFAFTQGQFVVGGGVFL